jgi:XRE family transcriptional regulator, fatty acid utilization regulator
MDASFLRLRIRALRESQGLSQSELAQQMGLKGHQTLSDIEQGERKISAEELIKAAQALSINLAVLTDPLRLVNEGAFSWRQKNVKPADLDAFESRAGQWIATYRHLCQLKGQVINSVTRKVALTPASSFEDAYAQGEAIGLALGLAEVPALNLADVVENQLDTLVLHVDALHGVSGAACQLDQLNTILINRNESAQRRSFDMAHELFHLLTWDRMPPDRLDGVSKTDSTKKRVEQLAENFAAGLLMPRATLATLVTQSPLPDESGLPKWLVKAATKLQVSPTALTWRMVNLGHLRKATADRILQAPQWPQSQSTKAATPARMSRRFVQVLGWGIEQGHLSVRRAASILDMTMEDMATLFQEHQYTPPFDL